MLPYKEKYDNFIKTYKTGIVSAENIGFLIAEMVNFYSDFNTMLGLYESQLNKKAAEIVSGQDPENLKPISVSKAELLIKATEQYDGYNKTKINLQNVEQIINGLKSLQKGVSNEFSHMGGI